MPEYQKYEVQVEARVQVVGTRGGVQAVVGEYVVREYVQANGRHGTVSALTDVAFGRVSAYAKAMSAGVENTEARRLK